MISLTVPSWFGRRSAALHALVSTPFAMSSALEVKSSSPRTCKFSPNSLVSREKADQSFLPGSSKETMRSGYFSSSAR